MDLQVRTNGTRVTEGMREFIDRRMSKLDRIAEHVVDARLELRTEETRTGSETTTAQLTLRTGRHVLRAEERDSEPARAIDKAIDKLITQVRKYNDKKVTRKKRAGQPATVTAGAITDVAPVDVPDSALDEDRDEEILSLVRTKRFAMKPMIVEEAIDQLELVGHDFFLFRNQDDNELNVLYRRRDGTYGLLAAAN
jgi:putative sigma-54 modulation protein